MNGEKVYEIVGVSSTTYLNSGVPVQGYLVRAKWANYNETVTLNVPTLDKDVINKRLMSLYLQRKDLDELGHLQTEE
jgi:hypothetical protein